MSRIKTHLANTGLVVVSLLVTYFVVEFVFFRMLLPSMPLQLRPHLPDRAFINFLGNLELIHTNKRGDEPGQSLPRLLDRGNQSVDAVLILRRQVKPPDLRRSNGFALTMVTIP